MRENTKKARKVATKHGFRSKFEYLNAQLLREHNQAYEYETLKIPYTIESVYTPDFFLYPNGLIIEIKGRFDDSDRRKHIAVREQHPDLEIRLVFQRDNFLRAPSKDKNGNIKGNPMRYSDWCNKHGIKFAVGRIPGPWLKNDVIYNKEYLKAKGLL